MAHARLVTHTPEYAQTLARSLEDAGYSVEFASPDVVSHGTLVGVPLAPADLEVNLDDPSAPSSYLMTPDGKEISFAYDSFEREFVLAPAWRKFKQAVAPLLENFRRPPVQENVHPDLQQPVVQQQTQTETIYANAPVSAEPAYAPPAYVDQSSVRVWETVADQPADDSAATTKLEPFSDSGVLTQSLYLPSPVFVGETAPVPVEFSGAEYFDGQGKRKLTGHEELTAVLPYRMAEEEIEPVAASSGVDVPQAELAVTAAPTAASSPRTPWLVSAAMRAEAARTLLVAQWKQRRESLAGAGSRLHGYDAEWLRAAPVAAVITLAFLMGWGYSNAQRSPEPPQPEASIVGEQLQQASVIPMPATKSASATRPVAAAPKAAKPSPNRRFEAHRYDSEEVDVALDVIVRHYPSRGTRAAVQPPKGTIKRFSDLE